MKRRFPNLGSISRNLTLLVVLAVLPALLIILYSGLDQRRRAIEAAKLESLFLANTMAEVQHGTARYTSQLLSTLAHMPEFQAMDSAGINQIIRAILDRNPDYINITALDTAGEVIASGAPFARVNLADRKHVREALATRNFAAGEYVVTRVGAQVPSFTYAFPIQAPEGEPTGVLTCAIRLERLANIFDVSVLPEDSFLLATDHQGIKLFRYPPRGDAVDPIGEQIADQAWEAALRTQRSGTVIFRGLDGVRRIVAFKPVRLDPAVPPYMYMWAGVSEERVLRHANSVLVRNLLLMLLATVLALAISFMISRSTLISPLQKLVATTRSLARGNHQARSGLADEPGELGVLARAFDDMADTLGRNQETLRTIADYTYDWEYWTGEDGTLKWVSPSCEQITGYSAAEFMADQGLMARLVHEDDAGEFARHLEEEKNGFQPAGNIDFRIIHRSGHVVWINHQCLSISGSDGTSLGRRSSNRDITERKRVEKEREKLQTQLVQSQKMESVGRLAGGVAHDFNNMLSVILGYAEMAMRKEISTGELHEDLKEIERAARRSADIVRQLLAFARQQTVEPKAVNLNETVGSMLKMLHRLIGEDIDLAWRPAADLWLVKIDPTQVDQMLANLCVNARDAIAGVGKVTIETSNITIEENYCASRAYCTPGQYVMLAVSDDGCGIAPEALANIFDPFFTTKELGQGTGLGLATVYGIVRQNQGYINVYSEPGQGTTFKIYLPRLTAEAAESRQSAISPGMPKGQGETVLLVEDDPAVMLIGIRMLEYLGYRVLMAETPGEALLLAREEPGPIHLLITDVVMPEMNGRELSLELLSCHPHLKCLFISGYTANVIAHRGVLDEGVFFLPKPFSLMDLALKVREVLDGPGRFPQKAASSLPPAFP